MNKNKGFTLIELLVVIAIIGILASVVLASLSSARDKGKDAAVKSQLASMKAQAELFYSAGDTYVGVCTTPATSNGFDDLLKATQASAGIATTFNLVLGTGGAYNVITCHEAADSWAVEAPMTDSTSTSIAMYCTDSTGVSMTTSNILTSNDVTCN